MNKLLLIALIIISPLFSDTTSVEIRNTITVLRPDEFKYDILVNLVLLNMDYTVAVQEILSESPEQFQKDMVQIDKAKPKAVLCIGEDAVTRFETYQATRKSEIPMIATLVPDVKKRLLTHTNVRGISDEVPLVTSAINLRDVMNTPIEKMGVLYTSEQKEFVETNDQFANNEDFTFLTEELPLTEEEILQKLPPVLEKLKQEEIDALWIGKNPQLTDKNIIQKVWKPFIKETKLPILVCDRDLVNPQLDLGLLAVYNDIGGLASQIAELIYEAQENNWHFDGLDVQVPISIQTTLNSELAKEYAIDSSNLLYIDEVFIAP